MFEKYLTPTGLLSRKQPQEVKTQWYTQRFKEVHGDTYDYSNVVYTNSYTNVKIICREHGCFTQRPSAHLEGKGCPKCGGKLRKTTETCIQDFVLISTIILKLSTLQTKIRLLLYVKNMENFGSQPKII